jgi:hypothetical protein
MGGTPMSFEIVHFRDSDKIIRKKKLDRDVKIRFNRVKRTFD